MRACVRACVCEYVCVCVYLRICKELLQVFLSIPAFPGITFSTERISRGSPGSPPCHTEEPSVTQCVFRGMFQHIESNGTLQDVMFFLA